MLLILKYVLWILTGVPTIVDKWFVKFTVDGDDGRKKLTRWGRIGRPIACICFVLALAVMFYGDFVEPRTDKKKFSPRLDIYVGPRSPHPRPSHPYPIVTGRS